MKSILLVASWAFALSPRRASRRAVGVASRADGAAARRLVVARGAAATRPVSRGGWSDREDDDDDEPDMEWSQEHDEPEAPPRRGERSPAWRLRPIDASRSEKNRL